MSGVTLNCLPPTFGVFPFCFYLCQNIVSVSWLFKLALLCWSGWTFSHLLISNLYLLFCTWPGVALEGEGSLLWTSSLWIQWVWIKTTESWGLKELMPWAVTWLSTSGRDSLCLTVPWLPRCSPLFPSMGLSSPFPAQGCEASPSCCFSLLPKLSTSPFPLPSWCSFPDPSTGRNSVGGSLLWVTAAWPITSRSFGVSSLPLS